MEYIHYVLYIGDHLKPMRNGHQINTTLAWEYGNVHRNNIHSTKITHHPVRNGANYDLWQLILCFLGFLYIFLLIQVHSCFYVLKEILMYPTVKYSGQLLISLNFFLTQLFLKLGINILEMSIKSNLWYLIHFFRKKGSILIEFGLEFSQHKKKTKLD